jgi:ABC-2 type transport system ATP-binding protein
VSKRFKERAVRFDRLEGLGEEDLRVLPGVGEVKVDDTEVLLYTRDVGPTIGALLALTEARGLEPQNLAIRRATLEDVFLDLTGRALRD